MTWDEFNEQEIDELIRHKKTDIDCPKCGRKVYFDSAIRLTSFPVKYYYWCKCGWNGYSAVKWRSDNDAIRFGKD